MAEDDCRRARDCEEQREAAAEETRGTRGTAAGSGAHAAGDGRARERVHAARPRRFTCGAWLGAMRGVTRGDAGCGDEWRAAWRSWARPTMAMVLDTSRGRTCSWKESRFSQCGTWPHNYIAIVGTATKKIVRLLK